MLQVLPIRFIRPQFFSFFRCLDYNTVYLRTKTVDRDVNIPTVVPIILHISDRSDGSHRKYIIDISDTSDRRDISDRSDVSDPHVTIYSSRYFEADTYNPENYDQAHVAKWKQYNLHGIARLSLVGSVLIHTLHNVS